MVFRLLREPLDPTERGRERRLGLEEAEKERDCRGGVWEKDESLADVGGGGEETGESVSAVDREVLLVSNGR